MDVKTVGIDLAKEVFSDWEGVTIPFAGTIGGN